MQHVKAEVVRALSMPLWYVKVNGVTVDSADRKYQAQDIAANYNRMLWKGRYNGVISK